MITAKNVMYGILVMVLGIVGLLIFSRFNKASSDTEEISDQTETLPLDEPEGKAITIDPVSRVRIITPNTAQNEPRELVLVEDGTNADDIHYTKIWLKKSGDLAPPGFTNTLSAARHAVVYTRTALKDAWINTKGSLSYHCLPDVDLTRLTNQAEWDFVLVIVRTINDGGTWAVGVLPVHNALPTVPEIKKSANRAMRLVQHSKHRLKPSPHKILDTHAVLASSDCKHWVPYDSANKRKTKFFLVHVAKR